ncbi:hypothetical protein V6N11_031604 [Hibiscus sabdariffa]|uniref:Uncharacterized protein n=1 Tax=Hibiscus sabdariffa TaxID=183260 RepID=A0ABR2SYX5_9ROSI
MGSPIRSSYIGVGLISMSIEPSDEKPQQANLSPARVEWTGQRSQNSHNETLAFLSLAASTASAVNVVPPLLLAPAVVLVAWLPTGSPHSLLLFSRVRITKSRQTKP